MSSLLVFLYKYIKNTNEDEFEIKNINKAKYNQPRTPLRLKSNVAPGFLVLPEFKTRARDGF